MCKEFYTMKGRQKTRILVVRLQVVGTEENKRKENCVLIWCFFPLAGKV